MDAPLSALSAQTREIIQTELIRVWEQDRRIQEVIDIDLPRPRPFPIKRTPKFIEYVDQKS